MLIKRILAPLAILLTMVGLSATSYGQHGQINSAGSKNFEANRNTDLEQTFSAYGDFDNDLQFFRPLDYADYTPEQEERTGLFFTYDRMFMKVSAPQKLIAIEGSPESATDFAYNLNGNRFESGLMSKQDSGFTITMMQTKGVGLTNIVNPDLDLTTTAPPLGKLPATTVTDFMSIEVNRTYRQRMKHGGYFEPYFGFRMMNLKDKYLLDTSVLLGVSERFSQEAHNLMYGGQVGMRAFHRTGRWTVSGNFSVSGSYNDQNYTVQDIYNLTATTFTNIQMNKNFSSFVPMGELRADMSYLLTRDISIRFGVEGMYFIKGINRVIQNNAFDNPNSLSFLGSPFLQPPSGVYALPDQRLWMWGATAGIEWRR